MQRASVHSSAVLALAALVVAWLPACSESKASTIPAGSRAGPLGASPEYLAVARDEFVAQTAFELAELQRRRIDGAGVAEDSDQLLEEERAAQQRLEELRHAPPREWELLRPGMHRCLEDLRSAVEGLASGG